MQTLPKRTDLPYMGLFSRLLDGYIIRRLFSGRLFSGMNVIVSFMTRDMSVAALSAL